MYHIVTDQVRWDFCKERKRQLGKELSFSPACSSIMGNTFHYCPERSNVIRGIKLQGLTAVMANLNPGIPIDGIPEVRSFGHFLLFFINGGCKLTGPIVTCLWLRRSTLPHFFAPIILLY